MPPKAKFTKAEIIEAALNIVRADGYEALTSLSWMSAKGYVTKSVSYDESDGSFTIS